MWTYRNRLRAAGAAKWALSAGMVIGIGNMIGMYVTYQDMHTVNEIGTVAMYALLIFIVRKMIR